MAKFKEYFLASMIAITGFKANANNTQEFKVQNNSDVTAIISTRELSRIVFEGEAVENLYSSGNEITYEIEGENLYLKPNIDKPINVFVKTEQGNTYKLLLTSKDIPSVQVFISNTDLNVSKESPLKTEEHSYNAENVFRRGLSKIISAVTAGDETVGFKKIKIGRSKKSDGLASYYDSDWHGSNLVASKYYLKNISDKELNLQRENYLTDKVNAVYLEKEMLAPGDMSVLITIEKGDGR